VKQSSPTNQPEPEYLPLNVTRWRAVPVFLILLAGDLLSFSLAFWLAASIRGELVSWFGKTLYRGEYTLFFLTSLFCLIGVYWYSGLYPGHGFNATEEIRQIFFSLSKGFSLLGMIIYLLKLGPEFPRTVFLLSWMFTLLFDTIFRLAIHKWATRSRWWGMPVAIIAPAETAEDFIQRLRRNHRLGFKPELVLDENLPKTRDLISTVRIFHSRDEFLSNCHAQHIQSVIYFENPTTASIPLPPQDMRWLANHFHTLVLVPSISHQASLWLRTIDLDGRLAIMTHYNLLERRFSILKRFFDLIVGILLSIILAPVGFLIALLIKLDSPGPVLYIQERLGLEGRPFRYIKFRTMVHNADQKLEEILETYPQAKREFQQHHKLLKDPRVTRIGQWLRRYSLDELPQLLHVMTGEMSLVGPRAYISFEFTGMGDYADLIFKIRPGITGWWQVMGRHANTFTHRLQLDEYYLCNWSPWLDIYILIKTVWVILRGYGI